jgi:hypothetical protein
MNQKWEKCMPVTFIIDDKIQHGHVYDQPTDDIVWCIYTDTAGHESIENFRPDEIRPDIVYSKPSTITIDGPWRQFPVVQDVMNKESLTNCLLASNVIRVNFTSSSLRGRVK